MNQRHTAYKAAALTAELLHHIGGKGWTRTSNARSFNPALYQLELLYHGTPQETRTLINGFVDRCSIR